MAKIKLGARPRTFQRNVKFQMLDGSEGSIGVIYKYRTRREFGALTDELMAEIRAENERASKDTGEPAEAISLETVWAQAGAKNADYLLRIAEGWDLDEPFTRESIEQLSDELPGAVTAIVHEYRTAIVEGRLGN